MSTGQRTVQRIINKRQGSGLMKRGLVGVEGRGQRQAIAGAGAWLRSMSVQGVPVGNQAEGPERAVQPGRTSTRRPPTTVPSRSRIASSASRGSVNSINPNPLGRLSRSWGGRGVSRERRRSSTGPGGAAEAHATLVQQPD
jgi:hypothetical protein